MQKFTATARVATGALMVAALAVGWAPAANAADSPSPQSYQLRAVAVTPRTLTFHLTLGSAESLRQDGQTVVVHDAISGTDVALPTTIPLEDTGRTATGRWSMGKGKTLLFELSSPPTPSDGTVTALDDYGDCVAKSGWGGLAGGAVAGCVVSSEVGCVEGGAAGGLAGGVAGLVGGLITCS